jgi:hypothetical protein
LASPSRYYSNVAVPGVLGAGISSTATSCYLSTTPSGYPAQFPFTLCLDQGTSSMELVSVTSGSGTAGTPWQITRGFDGSTAAAHGGVSTEGIVTHDFSAYDVSTSRSHEASGSGSGVHGLPASAWQTAAFAVINETILNNSTTSVQTWNSIPSSYTHLMVVVLGRLTETSQQSDYLTLQFNGDTGAYYSYMQMESNNTSGTLSSPTSVTSYAGSSIPFARLTASAGGVAANAGAVWAVIPWYTSTVFNKIILAQSGGGNGTSALVDGRMFWGFYNPAAQVAVSSISISAPSGSDFKSGTSFGLYGLS